MVGRSLLAAFGLTRQPEVGDIHWIPDEHMGIAAGIKHPALVVRGPGHNKGPVGLVPGSSTRPPDPGMPYLVVAPADVIPAGALARVTRFALHEGRRCSQAVLGPRIGRLGAERLDELRRMRVLGL